MTAFDVEAEAFAEAWSAGNVDVALVRARAAVGIVEPWWGFGPPIVTEWPPIEAYVLAAVCPRCGAGAGDECDVRRGRRRFHLQRVDRGLRHHRRDIVRAPWREDRVPGRRYDSLGAVMPAASS